MKFKNGTIFCGELFLSPFKNNQMEQKTNIQKLTELQAKLGYNRGPVNSANVVAILGIAGEAGEVLKEVQFFSNQPLGNPAHVLVTGIESKVNQFCRYGQLIDEDKKALRVMPGQTLSTFIPAIEDYKKELADLLYYINIECMNQGITLDDLAGISLDKVTAKLNSPT